VTDQNKLTALRTAINDVIIQYETAQEQAASSGNTQAAKAVPSTYSKTISFSNSSKGGVKKDDTYVVRGVVTSSSNSGSTMKIYIEQAPILTIGH
jgi:hypothetical protein